MEKRFLEKIFNKVTLVASPRGGSGTSTIANNLAYLFAKKGYITAVIELDRQCGTSPYLNNVIEKNTEKSLKRAMDSYEEESIVKSFVQSKHHDGLFTLSLRLHDELHSLYKFNIDQIQKIIKTARKKFDKVFIDVPMSYVDNGFIGALYIHPDQFIQILDDDIVTWHKLKLYEDFLERTKMKTFNNVFTVINKYQEIVPNKLVDELKKEMEILKLDKIYRIPYIKQVIKANNEGVLLADMIPATRKEKEFVKTLDSLYKDILNLKAESEEGKKVKKSRKLSLNLFSKKNKKAKKKKWDKGEKLNA